MEHIAYCETQAKELERLLAGEKTMLIRGAAGRKLPHGRVKAGEIVYLIPNDSSGRILAKAIVASVIDSEKLTTDASVSLIEQHLDKLMLNDRQKERWYGKRFLCLIDLKDVTEVEPFSYRREKNMDDWITVERIEDVIE
ncbi:MAG: hypothetical protein CVU86_04750 [Firmicutes bacterium HGW-Firmicutes-11]|jgi:hypothetical protein|nr:MAG: hypothetical protein CVU86_04750 [Firmicutes bacterium HGW-Firmicutes-11]